MKKIRSSAAFVLLAILFLLLSPAQADVTLSDTDYALPENWLRFADAQDKAVDVFALYPTVAFSPEQEDLPYLRMDSPVMREGAEGWFAENEALLTFGNIYAPLYRQLNGVMLGDLDSSGFASYTKGLPRDDAFSAFDYFLTHINKGERPFLLFGHSQGAQLVSEIAGLLLGDAKYAAYNSLHIATYAIGCSVLPEDISRNPDLAFAGAKTDNGVILSWNTTAPSEIATGAYKGFGTWKDGALVINPISWTAEETLAHAKDNPGSHLLDAEGKMQAVEGLANALVDREHSVLVVTTVDEANFPVMTPTVSRFHRWDVMFFYDSILQNMRDRAEAFLAPKP